MDGIWKKIGTTSWYQFEKVMDLAAYLEHLQTVIKEFDATTAPKKNLLICYFQDGIRPSIHV